MIRAKSEAADRTVEAEGVFDALVFEASAKLEAGEAVDLDAIGSEYPEHVDRFRKLLPTLQAMAELGHSETALFAASSESREAAELQTGVLGDYRILGEVGRGGMGVVYEAQQVSLGRKVALKVLPFAAMLDRKQLQRFQNEARAAASLRHPNIVQVHFVGCERAVHFYAMDFIEGQTLAQLIHHLRRLEGLEEEVPADAGEPASSLADSLASGRFAPPKASSDPDAPTAAFTPERTPDRVAGNDGVAGVERSELPAAETKPAPQAGISTQRSTKTPAYFRSIADLGVQLAEALDHAHEHGVIHRDIKPSNVILDNGGKPWITDFGLARIETDATLTVSGDLLGTLRYMSPEQALAKRVVVDHRTDIYSLGATLYELLTLQPVFSGQDRQKLLRQVAFDEPHLPRKLNRAIPAELETIILKAIAKNPAERYATAQELADDLQRFLDDKPIRARRPSLVQRAAKWSRRHKPLVISVASVAVILLIATTLVSLSFATRERELVQQRLDVNQKINDALADVTRLRAEAAAAPPGDLKSLVAARQFAERAKALSEHRLADPRLAARAKTLLMHLVKEDRDHALMARLEKARLGGAETDAQASRFSRELTIPQYRAAFAWYGLAFGKTSPDEAARRIRGCPSGVKAAIISVLDDWNGIESKSSGKLPHKKAEREWRVAVIEAADDDDWRRRVREALKSSDSQALVELAHSSDVTEQAPQTLLALGEALCGTPENWELGIDLLRRAQRQYPGDFWINDALGQQYWKKESPEANEAVRFFTAAVAIRPDTAGARLNLGSALAKNGDLADAVAVYRKAIQLDPEYAGAYDNLAIVYHRQRRYDKAEQLYKQTLEIRRRVLGEEDVDTLVSMGNLALVYYRQRRYAEAEKLHTQMLEIRRRTLGEEHPDTLGSMNNLANVYHRQRRYAEAEKLHTQAMEIGRRTLGPEHPQMLAWSAHWAVLYSNRAWQLATCADPNQRDGKRAVELARKAVEIKGETANLLDNLGVAHYRAGDWQAAADALEKASQMRDGRDYYHRFFLAMAHWQLGNKEAARQRYTQTIEWMDRRKSNKQELLRFRSEAEQLMGLTEEDRYTILADYYQKAIQSNPEDPAGWVHRATSCAHLGEWEKACDDFNKAVELGPDDSVPWAQRACFHADQGRLVQALADISKALALAPDDWKVWRDRGQVYEKLDQWDKAIADHGKAIELSDKPWQYWQKHVQAYETEGHWDGVVALWSKLLEHNPDDAQPWRKRAGAHAKLGAHDKAVEDYNEAIRLDPSNASTFNVRSIALCRLGQFERALQDSNRAINLAPKGYMYCHRAWSHIELGNYDQAVADCDEALRLGGGANYAYIAYGRRGWALLKLGEVDRAIQDLTRAIDLRPGVRAYEFRARAYTSRGEFDQAVADLTAAIELAPDNLALRFQRGDLYAICGHWDKALADFDDLLERDPSNLGARVGREIVSLGSGGVDGYRRACHKLLSEAVDSDKGEAATEAAVLCKQAPDAVDDWTQVIQLAKKAHESATDRG